MGESPEPDQLCDDIGWREPLVAFAIVVVILAAASGLSMALPFLSGYLLALAAALFIGVPFLILRRKGADFHRFGIDLERIPLKHVGLGLLVSVVIFPLFVFGYFVWETSIAERDLHFSWDNYRQWSVELEAPNLTHSGDEVVQIRTSGNLLHVEWKASAPSETTIVVSADQGFSWDFMGRVSAAPITADIIDDGDLPAPPTTGVDARPAQLWHLATAGRDGRLVLSPLSQPADASVPNRLKFQLHIPEDATPPDVYKGSQAQSADEPIEVHRNYWWLVLWGLTHLLVIALPEEYFYRGYLQTRFHDLFGDTDSDKPKSFLGFSRANWLTSAFFALGHVLIPIGGTFSVARGAVFFPSLIFGWLRDRTGSIIAPVIFHAAANMMVLVVAVHYF